MISDIIYQISYILYKISDILNQINRINSETACHNFIHSQVSMVSNDLQTNTYVSVQLYYIKCFIKNIGSSQLIHPPIIFKSN